ncbi:hypothetical protein Mgra_00006012 [Meloidogyne graminicola]|uniref:RING-type domain-containing protein n=1 Tax=Meloidogyne graminicola TaxID=189291 RepID=A0A8S9ZMC0_9BILA|nr:hypothetical protein Mgra_00006012 [Meloidogyne graminicola]
MKNKRKSGRSSGSSITRKSPRKDTPNDKTKQHSRWVFRPRTSLNSSFGQGTSMSTNSSNTFVQDSDSDDNDEDITISIELLKSIFPDQIVDDIKELSPGARLMAMANYIIDNSGEFKSKPKKKVDIPEDQLEPTFGSVDSALSRDANFRPKLLDAFFEDFRDHYALHFSRRNNAIYDREICYRLLYQHFPTCRTPLIEFLIDEFAGRYSTAAWICFFVQSNLGYLVRPFFLHIEMRTWTIMTIPLPEPRKRRNNWILNPTNGSIADSIEEFNKALTRFRNDYKQLFCTNENSLLPNVEHIEDSENIETFECLVCTGEFPINRAIFCNSHPFGEKTFQIVDLDIQGNKQGAECRFYIPPNIRRHLNARILEESLGAANLVNLERENKLSEAIIRRCYRCSVPFVKLAGCNQMSCRCGAVQCYLCRAKDINYNHFCQHFRNPKQKGCTQCKKTCLLWHPENYVDEIAINKVRKEAEDEGIVLE